MFAVLGVMMFKRPEELIMAVLAVLWVAVSYFAASYVSPPRDTALLVAALTLIWSAVFFMLWQRGLTRLVWPLFWGLLTLCWWPLWDWYADGKVAVGGHWTASPLLWGVKAVLFLLPAAAGYVFMFKKRCRLRDK